MTSMSLNCILMTPWRGNWYHGTSSAALFTSLSWEKLREHSLVLFAVGRACCSRNRCRSSLRSVCDLPYCERSSLGNCCRVGGDRLFHKRSILREGPLQNRRNLLSTPQYHRCTKRSLSHLIRLEPVLVCFHRNPDRKLRSRMDLEEVLVMHDMAGADDVRNYLG